jgi:hypothetical protein
MSLVVEEGSATYVQTAAVSGDFFGVVAYQNLLDLRNDAEPEIAFVKQARVEYARLR